MLRITALSGFGAGGGVKSFGVVLGSNRTDYDLASDLQTSHGWDGVSPVKASVTVNAGVAVNASSTVAYAFRIALPAGSQATVVNHGSIIGRGGKGGNADGGSGQAGGVALSTGVPTAIDNQGMIAGGGGGGGAGHGGSDWCSQGEETYSCSVQGGAAGKYLAGAANVTWITIGDVRGPSS